MNNLTENDWNHMHDCILHLTSEKKTKEELLVIFNNLPDFLKTEAFDWGMSDTLWRDRFIALYERKNKR